ncbi:MFS transporter [Staphylococcus gallinarum]|uniref:MFS transporter n=1 Tax=Staphylococcus gallinarum TaxID=1293 RepID=UPI002DB556E4|nr:MFS transporter [Staphylococcus gallinarum]MEB7040091.1 MFS transporter [Staphylococcus gallinarum]
MKNINKNIKVRMIEVFINKFTGSAILPFMTIYFTVNFGLKFASILVFINISISIISSYFSGFVSDHFGRKRVLVFASVFKSITFILLAIANSPYAHMPSFTFIMILINTVCSNMSDTSGQAMIIDLSDKDQRKHIYPILYWIKNSAVALGGVVGILFFKDYLFFLFGAFFFLSLVNSIVIVKFLKNYENKHSNSVFLEMLSSYKKVLTDRDFIIFNLGAIILVSLEVQLTNYIAIKLHNEIHNQHFLFWNLDGVQMVGILKTENTLLVVILTIFVPYLIKRINDIISLLIGSIIFIIGFSLLSYTDSVFLLLFSMLIQTIGEIIYAPTVEYFSSLMIPKNFEGRYVAIRNMISELTMLTVPGILFLSSFLQYFTITLLFLVIGLVGITSMLIIIKTRDIY